MADGLFGDYEFMLVAELQLARDDSGNIVQDSYHLGPSVQPNSHASGPFCRFRLANAPAGSGVYAITVEGALKYIGKSGNLLKRFGPNGYGRISARNCHSDGQATNCRINASILTEAKAGQRIMLWFHSSSDYEAAEAFLINQLRPSWNSRRETISNDSRSSPRRNPKKAATGCDTNATSEAFRNALNQEFAIASARGDASVIVFAGDLHRKVGGYPATGHRMPVCCRVMRSMMLTTDRIVDTPPRGAGARLTIEYKLPRTSASERHE